MVDDPWSGEVHERIAAMCDSCVEVAEVDGGGVSLLSSHGERAVLHTTDKASEALERLQMEFAEGPCVDVGVTYSPILISDLLDRSEGLGDRWPFFLREANKLGVRAVFTFPLRVGSVVLGTLELHRSRPGPLAPRQFNQVMETTRNMGGAMVDGAINTGVLGHSVATVHQAAGMVMIQLDTNIKEAMAHLRASAFAEGVSLLTLSTDVVEGRRHFTKEQS